MGASGSISCSCQALQADRSSSRAKCCRARTLMIDANQVWEVGQAIDWVKRLGFARPFFIEEPTSPDDVLDGAIDPFISAALAQRVTGEEVEIEDVD